ncbi:GerAB/ArcD/ProY family transporter [Paenibacillus methanolicus]|uniref:Spore germination protein (Amino acid permease) n=1 Tax=Paenibacillus methanolicus TaxID=582686 RepID=A0A5S5CLH2_9BACL|nr:endospore germination permease [Paenibacillus methanolicus]TYP79555.1 spore germination protein (amino acid permease) [Paenibacillus methanolicus]
MNVRITNGMLLALVMNVIYAKAIGITQGIIAREVASDMWLSTLIGMLQGIAAAWLTARVIRMGGQASMIDIASKAAGKWAGKLIAAVLLLFFTGAFATVLVTFTYHLMDYFLPEAPVILFVVAALAVGLYGAYHGVEVMGRMAFVGVFSILILNILVMMGSIAEFDVKNLLPVMDSGLARTVWASRHFDTDWSLATMMIAILLPHVKKPQRWGRASAVSILFAGLTVAIWPILETGVLSAEATREYIVACMQLARSAHIGLFLHRYEMIMVAFFATSSLIQIMMSLFCASVCASKIVGVNDYRLLLLPTALLLGGTGYWIVADHLRAMIFTADYWPLFAVPVAIGIPLLIGGISMLRRNKEPAV